MSVSQQRALASRIAKWMQDKGRSEDAVGLLSAWAAGGPNDAEGQNLLAEAFRINPGAPVAKLAFERMEGISGDHALLDAAIERWSEVELQRLEKEMSRPAFRKAQVGFNNNVKYKNQVFHIQTEDSGLDKPHVITHLFADGGRVLKSHKRSYADSVHREDVALYVRQLMKGQQLEMAMMLKVGRFDPVIAGKAIGGMEVLQHPPQVDVQRLATKKNEKVEVPDGASRHQTSIPPPAPDAPPVVLASAEPAVLPAGLPDPSAAPSALPAEPDVGDTQPVGPGDEPDLLTIPAPPPSATSSPALPLVAPRPSRPEVRKGPARFRLHVLRSLTGGPAVYEPRGDSAVIGTNGSITMVGERFCHPREAAVEFKNGRVWLEDFEAGNGVFLRVHAPVELRFGDEFIIGDQLLRLERNPNPNDGPGPGPTYFYSSPRWVSSFRVVQIFEGGALGACVVARGSTLQIGSALGDMLLPGDPLVSEQHCVLEEHAGSVILTDLGSRTGAFVRIKGEQELVHGDELLIGRTRVQLEIV